MKKLLFQSGTGNNFHDSWVQGFYFDPKMKYGLVQDEGGPCGIIATVNAFILKHLLFCMKGDLENPGDSKVTSNIVAAAITDILLNSSNNGETKI